MRVKKILVAEDCPLTSQWIGELLQAQFEGAVIVPVESVGGAKRCLATDVFDLVILDLNLADGSGIEVLLQLRRAGLATLVVVMTIYGDDNSIFSALRAGANGYLLKEQPREEIALQLRAILAGEAPLSPSVASRMLNYFRQQAGTPDEAAGTLTAREREILILVAKGYSRKEIAGLLEITTNTASSYIKSIYKKLAINSRAEAAIEANRLGLIQVFPQ